MALTSEILRANAATAGLTDEQVNAIVTMSRNDEDSVIGQKTGEIYGGLDADILAASGIAKNGTEKTYDYAKRVIGEMKGQAGKATELQGQIDTLTAEKTRLEGIIAKGGADAETKRQLAQAQADLGNVTKQYNDLKTQFDTAETKHKQELFDFRLSSDLSAASAGLKFKADLPKAVTDVLLKQAMATVKGMSPEYVENNGVQTLVFMENGAVKRNPNNALNPYTAAELLTDTLKGMGVLEEGRKQTGTGSHFTPPGGSGNANVDLAGATTQKQAYEAITKSLLAQGKTIGSKEFEEAMQAAWKENNIKALPLQ